MYSKAALALSLLLIFITGFFYYPRWQQSGTEATISWDASGYYMYLPALFIYKDIRHCRFQDSILTKYSPTPDFQQAFKHSSGNYVMKYSSGQALMSAPFFFIAHAIARYSHHYPADGFSFPYQLSIAIGMFLITAIGLSVLRNVLRQFFNDLTTALTILLFAFASNYLNYAAVDAAMTHNTLFTLYALVLWNTLRFYEDPTRLRACIIGLLVGLAMLTRPTEIISLLIPVLWKVESVPALKSRLQFFLSNRSKAVIAIASAALLYSIQPIYWKCVSGEWFVYSYRNEGFDWLKPHVFNCLLSYRSGWLTYSPVMIFCILGLVPLYQRRQNIFWPILIFSLLFTYLCFAWQTWWYGGSLGQRAMVQAYPVLAFPFAAFMERILKSKLLTKTLVAIFVCFCIWYNLWLTHQAHRGGLLRAGEMTQAYFWAIFGKNSVDPRTETLLDNEALFQGNPRTSIVIYGNNFSQRKHSNKVYSGDDGMLELTKNTPFSEEFRFKLYAFGQKWIRASADFYTPHKEWEVWRMPQFVMKFYRNQKVIKSAQIRVSRIMNEGERKNIWLDVLIPQKEFDEISVVFWNAESGKPVYIDNLKVICF